MATKLRANRRYCCRSVHRLRTNNTAAHCVPGVTLGIALAFLQPSDPRRKELLLPLLMMRKQTWEVMSLSSFSVSA